MGGTESLLEERSETVTIRCPHCNEVSTVESPTNQCVLSVECPKCHALIEKTDDGCCVYCAHAYSADTKPSCVGSCE